VILLQDGWLLQATMAKVEFMRQLVP
jgi:hypothetical protein